MIATVAVVAEEQLVVIVGGAADGTILALDALPAVALHGNHHVGGELQAGGMSRPTTVTARDQLLGRARFLVLPRVSQTEVTVRRWRC